MQNIAKKQYAAKDEKYKKKKLLKAFKGYKVKQYAVILYRAISTSAKTL